MVTTNFWTPETKNGQIFLVFLGEIKPPKVSWKNLKLYECKVSIVFVLADPENTKKKK